MAWQLLAAAIPTVAKLATTAINKPKEEDYKAQTKYMEKYLANLRGQQSSNAVFEQAMRPALRTIGAQSRQQQQQIGYNVQRSGLAGSGIEAQQRLTASQGTQEALAGATERAASAQTIANQQLGREAMKVSSQIEMERERAAQAYDQAMTQYDRNLKGIAVEGLANVATAGVGMIQTNVQNEKYLATAKSFLSNDEYTSMLAAGVDPAVMQNYAMQMRQTELDLIKSIGENYTVEQINNIMNNPGSLNSILKDNNTNNTDSVDIIEDPGQTFDDVYAPETTNTNTQSPQQPTNEAQDSEVDSPSASGSNQGRMEVEMLEPVEVTAPKPLDLDPQERLELKKQWQGLSKSARSVFESVDYSETNTGVGLTGEPEVWDEVLKSYIRIKGDPTGDLNKVNDFSAWARQNYEKIKKGMGE